VIGGRQQRIGGSLPGATTIANFLAQYRDTEVRRQPFGGREDELRQLDEWLRTPEVPYLCLAALPGQGKSALLSRWCERLTADGGADQLRIVFVPISIRFEFNRQETVLRAMASQLAAIHDEPAFGKSAEDWRDLISEFMLRAPPQGTRVLVILDGLDEAAGWQAGPSLVPNPPHHNVKLVVSARMTATHPHPEDWLRDLGWSQAPAVVLRPLTVPGVREVLLHMGSRLRALADDPVTVARLHQISAGDPLVVGLYAGYLWDNPLPSTKAPLDWLEEANPGLDGFIDRWWADQQPLRGRPTTAVNPRRVFDFLACALGPLERGELLELARRSQPLSGDDLDAALVALDRLVIATSPRVYAIAHPRLLERRLIRLAEDDDLGSLEQSYIDWAAESLQRTSKPLRPYIVRHYGQHLERAQAQPDQMIDLLSPAWRSAWLMVTDDITGWIDDIDRVHAAASRADAAAIGAQARAIWSAERLWSTCLRAEADAAYDLVDGTFARVLVQRGLWSERRALNRCALIGNSWGRAEYLTALAPALSRDGARLAAQIACTLDGTHDPAREAVAAVVACLVTHGDLPAAREFIADVESPLLGAAAVVATFPALAEDERLKALRRLDSDRIGARITQLAPRVDPELARLAFGDPPWRYLERQLRGKMQWWPAEVTLDELDPQAQALALESLAPWMTPAELERQVNTCIDKLVAYPSPFYDVYHSIESLAPHLKSATWHHARTTAHDTLRDYPGLLLCADFWLLPYAPPDASPALLDHLAKSVPELLKHPDPTDVSKALRALAAYGASAAVLDALADLNEENWHKAEYLAAVAPHLDLSEVHRALEIAATARRENQPTALTALLGRQAECGDAEAALASSSGSHDPDEMGAALAVLRVASGRESFSEAVTSLVAIDDRPLRVAAAMVAARLSPPTGADLLRVTESFGDPFDFKGHMLQMEMLANLASEIRDEEWADKDALQTVTNRIRKGLHPRKSQIMVEHFRRFARVRGIEKTLRQAWAYCTDTYDWPLACAAAAVASQLEPGMELNRNQLVSQASDHAAVVMAATLRLLPPAERREALSVALEAFPGSTALHSWAAALLLGALPEEFYETAADALIPDALLDGHSPFAEPANWAGSMADLCPMLDRRRLQRLLAASRDLKSAHVRSALRAPIAVRLAALGEAETALQRVDRLDDDYAAAALQQIAQTAPPAAIPSLLEQTRAQVSYQYSRGPRALATAALGRRMNELPPARLSDLLNRWHASAPKRGEVLVDLLAYGPVLLALAGGEQAGKLVERLETL
jgi:hypothetical protein